jgi:hypothetical protein
VNFGAVIPPKHAVKRLAFALCAVAMMATAMAEDHLVLIQYSGLPPPGRPADNVAVRYTISGEKFRRVQKDVEAVVQLLGTKTVWWDVAPDASWESLEIHLGAKQYVINSWYPLFRDNQKLAVSETSGLVAVSGSEEKQRVENSNSAGYRTIVGLFEKVQSVIRSGP